MVDVAGIEPAASSLRIRFRALKRQVLVGKPLQALIAVSATLW
jgi:hypothetical protein